MSCYPVYGNRMHPSSVPSYVAARLGTSDVPVDHGILGPTRSTCAKVCSACRGMREPPCKGPLVACTSCTHWLCQACSDKHAGLCGYCQWKSARARALKPEVSK